MMGQFAENVLPSTRAPEPEAEEKKKIWNSDFEKYSEDPNKGMTWNEFYDFYYKELDRKVRKGPFCRHFLQADDNDDYILS